MNVYLDRKHAQRIDGRTFIKVLTQLKDIELLHERENEEDEYRKLSQVTHNAVVDAFVGLGGLPSKDGEISKSTLI